MVFFSSPDARSLALHPRTARNECKPGRVWLHQARPLTLFPGVVFSGWYGGVGPSLVTIALGMLAAVYFWIPPRYTFTEVSFLIRGELDRHT
jgi:hypothetical protein